MQRHHSELGSHCSRSNADFSVFEGSDHIRTRGRAQGLTLALQRTFASQAQAWRLGWRLITESTTDFLAAAEFRSGLALAERSPLGGHIKRFLDLLIASLALIVLLPLMLTIALVAKLTMGGPVIFSQSRVGLNGKLFRCYKFRTMVTDAEDALRRYVQEDPHLAREWDEARKLSHDPRVTPIGRILRKTSLDELPQLFNVLRGDMSCVGPRPVVPAELERYGDQAREYLMARPGLTGLWQVSGRTTLSYTKRVTLDYLYVRNWSLFLDLAILVKTIPALLNFNEAA